TRADPRFNHTVAVVDVAGRDAACRLLDTLPVAVVDEGCKRRHPLLHCSQPVLGVPFEGSRAIAREVAVRIVGVVDRRDGLAHLIRVRPSVAARVRGRYRHVAAARRNLCLPHESIIGGYLRWLPAYCYGRRFIQTPPEKESAPSLARREFIPVVVSRSR